MPLHIVASIANKTNDKSLFALLPLFTINSPTVPAKPINSPTAFVIRIFSLKKTSVINKVKRGVNAFIMEVSELLMPF